LIPFLSVVVASVAHVGVESVTPLTNLLVLEVHVDWESIEEEDIGKEDTPNE
jgi:hypothetical protein